MRSSVVAVLLCLLTTSAMPADSPSKVSSETMLLVLRTRVKPYHASEIWTEANVEQVFPTAKAAIIITDMWDNHWCEGAAARVSQIAHRMEPLLQKARASGILIIHAPSETMSFYEGTAGRKLAEDAPHVPTPPTDPLHDPPLPIDDSNGGCDTGNKFYRAWSRETSALTIAPGDVISDSGAEIFNVLKQHGIDTAFFMGVHANKCILNRTFGIRQLSRWGIRCVLVRDLTDAMYEPSSRPFVSHAAGTELVIEYIEQHWAPTVTSTQILQALSDKKPDAHAAETAQ